MAEGIDHGVAKDLLCNSDQSTLIQHPKNRYQRASRKKADLASATSG